MLAPLGSGHLRPLTSLRFVAAGLIVLLHVRGLFGISADFGEPFLFGQGVSFFFVLSGFILVHVYPEVSRAGAGRFWAARVARIWPAHVAALLLLLLLLPETRPAVDSAFTGGLLTNIFLVHTWNPVGDQYYSYNSVSWSVSTELAFYLCFPLLLIGWRRTWHWKLILALVIAGLMIVLGNAGHFPASDPDAQGFRTIFPLQVHPLSRLFEFTLGMSAALVWRELASRRPLGFRIGSLCEIVAVILVILLMYNTDAWADAAGLQTWIGDAGWTWLRGGGIPALGFALLIVVLALQQGVVSRALSIPLFVLLGEISYAVYLVHQILVRHYLNHAQSFTVLPPWLLLCLFIALTLLVSYLLWSLVEKPFRALIVGWWSLRIGHDPERAAGNAARSSAAHSVSSISPSVIAALVALLALVAPVVYLTMFRASIAQVTPAYAQDIALGVPKRLRNIDFGDAFVLVGSELQTNSESVELELVWQSTQRQRLDYWVAVHVVDADGKILSNFDRPQDPAAPWIEAGTLWRDIIPLSRDRLEGGSAVAIGLYRQPEGLLPVGRGPRDLKKDRLLIALDTVPRNTEPADADGKT